MGIGLETWSSVGIVGELQYCSNNAISPGASYFTFINPVVCNKLGNDGAVCTSTSSYYRLSLGHLAQDH